MEYLYKCDICGRKLKRRNLSYGITYCDKHYKQFKKYGKCLDNNPRTIQDRNEYHIKGKITYIDLYNKYCIKIAETKIDTEDLDKVKYIKWKYANGYARNTPKHGEVKHLSRMILGLTNKDKDKFVDHINHDTLDNRKKNLRIVTKSQNQMNMNYKGVTKTKHGNFIPRIKIHGKEIKLGAYIDEREAYFARWYAEKLLFKEYRYKKEKPEIDKEREKIIKGLVKRKVQRL